jgi:hypothetical protein
MVLREISPRKLPLVHSSFTLFPNGNLAVPRPKIGPLDLRPMPTFLLFVTVLFAAVGVGLIALRHSSYGRRLTALKDSPAASATLGQSPVRLKLSVFMLSAAIAGIGGALMTAQLGSANLDRYDIFLSLSLLTLTVVGGIGYVGGALVGGILFGVVFLAMQNTFAKLGADHASLEGMFDFLARLTTVLPALMGVSMGRNPSGAVHDIVENFSPLGRPRARPILVAGIVAEGVFFYLAREDLISNWWFLVLTGLTIVALPGALRLLTPGGPSPVPEDLTLELVGIDRPFTPADRDVLDRALEVPSGATRR